MNQAECETAPGYTLPMDPLLPYRQGRYGEALALARAQGSPRELVLALLALGADGEAEVALKAWAPKGEAEAAERLALLGFLLARRGDHLAYRRLALVAAGRAQTPLTLYHLGLALPPREAALALEEALALPQAGPEAEGALRLALALAYERLGDPRALPQAALARLKAPSPWTLLHHLRQELLFGEAPLEGMAGAVEPYLLHEARGVRLLAGYLLLFLRLLEGGRRAAGELLLGLLPQLGGPSSRGPGSTSRGRKRRGSMNSPWASSVGPAPRPTPTWSERPTFWRPWSPSGPSRPGPISWPWAGRPSPRRSGP